MGRKIAIVSGKGGVGKTTVTFGIGCALAKNGHSVCLVDLDIGLNNLDILVGVEDKVVYDLYDCLDGKCRIKQAVIPCEFQENLYIISSAKCDSAVDISQVKLDMLTNKLASVFDYVLIDSSAGVNNNFFLALKTASEAILIVTPHIASIRDADKVVGIINGQGKINLGVVVNRVRGDLVLRGESLSYKQIGFLLKTNIAGVLPESDEINVLCGQLRYKI